MNAAATPVERPARLFAAGLAVWVAVVGIWGPTAPLFPRTVTVAAGGIVAAGCLFSAIRPSPLRLHIALLAVAAFAVTAATRVLVNDYDPERVQVVGVATYATMAEAAIVVAVMTGLLERIDAAIEGSEADE